MRSTVLLVMAAVMTVSACGIAVRLAWVEVGGRHLAYAQTKGTCPNPRLIDTFEGGNANQQSDTFNTTTDSFRVSWRTTNTLGAEAEGSLYIYVNGANDPNALPVESVFQEGTGRGETFVNTPPGSYFLDIISGGLDYTITVEQCARGDPRRNPKPLRRAPRRRPRQARLRSQPRARPRQLLLPHRHPRKSRSQDQADRRRVPCRSCPTAAVRRNTPSNGAERATGSFSLTPPLPPGCQWRGGEDHRNEKTGVQARTAARAG